MRPRPTLRSGLARFALVSIPLLVLPGEIAAQEPSDEPEVFVQLGHPGFAQRSLPLPGAGETRFLSSDGEKILWDAATGLELRRFQRAETASDILAAFEDGTRVLSAFSTGEPGEETYGFEIWSLDDGEPSMRVDGAHEDYISGFAILPGGESFLSASWDGSVKLWSLDGALRGRFDDGSGDQIDALALAPDGRSFLALGSAGGGAPLKLWSLDDLAGAVEGSVAAPSRRYGHRAISAAFLPDGQGAAVLRDDRTLLLLDLGSGETRWSERVDAGDGTFGQIALSQDGRRLLWAGWTPEAQVRDAASGELLHALEGHLKGVHEAWFLNDDRWILTKGFDREMRLFDAASGRHLRDIAGESTPVAAAAFSPDGRLLAVALGDPARAYRGGAICLWDLEAGALLASVPLGEDGPDRLEFSPGGEWLLAGGWMHPLSLWSVPGLAAVDEIDLATPAFAISPDGRLLARNASLHPDARLELHELLGDSAPSALDEDSRAANSFAFSPDGSRLYAGVYGGLVLDAASGARLGRLGGQPAADPLDPLSGFRTQAERERDHAEQVLASPDGRFVLTRNRDVFKIFDAGTLAELRQLAAPGRAAGPWVAAVSPDSGLLLAPGDAEGEIDLWDVEAGRKERTFAKHRGLLTSLAFSPDGTRFVSGARDGSAVLWDLASGEALLDFAATPQGEWVAVTREGYYAASSEGHRMMNVRSEGQVFAIEQFYDVFYRPDLVERKLRGEDLASLISRVTFAAAIALPPPKVGILAPEPEAGLSERTCTVRLLVEDRGGGIGDVRLYHQGKLVESSGVYRLASDLGAAPAGSAADGTAPAYVLADAGLRMARAGVDPADGSLRVEEKPEGPGLADPAEAERSGGFVEFRVSLVPGENTLAASAFNGENTISSALERVVVAADLPERDPRLFALAVGVDRFAAPGFDLELPIKDARDFAALLEAGAADLYPEREIRVLEDASKFEVLLAVADLAALAEPEDLFVFFGASHGLARDDLYYFLASDYDARPGALERGAISSWELMELSKQIPALRQVYLLDTCHSGGFGNAVAGLYDARISVLARATGIHLLAGALVDQGAIDSYEGNGLFTHFVLRGMRGEADLDRDGKVTVEEMRPFLEREVREALGGFQEVFARNFGADLDLARARGEER